MVVVLQKRGKKARNSTTWIIRIESHPLLRYLIEPDQRLHYLHHVRMGIEALQDVASNWLVWQDEAENRIH